MNAQRIDALMQAVLDGEASPEEAREVEIGLATDPEARERFEELKVVFDGLRRVPKVFPPEGLIAAVLAALPAHPGTASRENQLLGETGVIRPSSRNGGGQHRRRGERFFRVLQPWTYPRGTAMNERNNGLSTHRKIAIGGGLAIAAAAVAVSLGIFPPNSSETSGTIVPAQRYQAPQPQQVDVGTTAGAPVQGAQTNAAGGQAGLQGTQQGTLAGTQQGTLAGTQQGTLAGTQQGTLAGTQQGTLAGTQQGTLAGTQQGTLAGTQQGTLAGTQQGTLAGQQQGTLAGQQQGTLSGTQQGTLAGQQQGTLAGQQQGTLAGQQKGMLGQQSAMQSGVAK